MRVLLALSVGYVMRQRKQLNMRSGRFFPCTPMLRLVAQSGRLSDAPVRSGNGSRRAAFLRRAVMLFFTAALVVPCAAQSVSNGKLLYTTPFVAGQRSCSYGGCHGIDPTANQNQIRNGGNAPEIASAIQIVRLMAFLKDLPTAAQINDIAAYIRNPASAATAATMVEFHFAALDYYFMTSRPTEIGLLDVTTGWSRTGNVVHVTNSAARTGVVPLRRYYFDQVAVKNTRGSHFYTLVPAEQASLRALNPRNTMAAGLPFDEGFDAYALPPAVEGVGGSCDSGQTPVYRLFRGQSRFPDNPNHRFTTDITLYNNFIALGWDGEGVTFCALSL